ncbi:hypothetical protein NBRC116583_23910 [Arenicella sp. 4NH20-0111]|uniref:hypothetical protein n=1 Tax=Arenicella sp. 4NH20-0111 TaxID=3127648 RepID=UPI00310ABD99
MTEAEFDRLLEAERSTSLERVQRVKLSWPLFYLLLSVHAAFNQFRAKVKKLIKRLFGMW